MAVTAILQLIFHPRQNDMFWLVAAVAVSSGLMVMNPIHIAGTLVVANSEQERQNDVLRIFLFTSLSLQRWR